MRTVGPFRRVLVGFDGSPDAAAAVRAAVAIAARDGGHVVVLAVRRPAQGGDGEDAGGQDMRAAAEQIFAQVRRESTVGQPVRMSVQIVYSEGRDLARVVTDYATEHGFDVLVLGRRGEGQGRRGLGRVADTAVRTCGLPVLLLSAS